MFLGQLMDLKEKQIEKFNEANELYKEVERAKSKLELSNLTEGQLKQINEIMALKFQNQEGNKEKDMSQKEAMEKADQIRKELIEQIKEAALTGAKEHSMSMMKTGEKGESGGVLDFKKVMASMVGGSGSFKNSSGSNSFSMVDPSDIVQPMIEQYMGPGLDVKPHGVEFEHKATHGGMEATCLKFNVQGNLLGTGGADSAIKIWDVS